MFSDFEVSHEGVASVGKHQLGLVEDTHWLGIAESVVGTLEDGVLASPLADVLTAFGTPPGQAYLVVVTGEGIPCEHGDLLLGWAWLEHHLPVGVVHVRRVHDQ